MASRMQAYSWLVALTVAAGCGGNTFTDGSDAGVAGAGGSGATGGHGGSGTGGTGGTAATGGVAGGAGSVAGGAGTGGACDEACPDIACGPGSEPVTTPDGCCFTCEPIPGYCEGGSCLSGIECAQGSFYFEFAPGCCACTPVACSTAGVSCAFGECPDGQHLELPAESCCPACVGETAACSVGEASCDQVQCAPGYLHLTGNTPGCCLGCAPDPDFCVPQAQAYRMFLTEQIGRIGGLSCNADSECTLADYSSACGADCGTAVNTTMADAVRDLAEVYSRDNCYECPFPGGACPPVVLTAKCYLGLCTASTG